MRNYKMRGGNANTLPLEYFGGDSGRYSVSPPAPGQCAYGQVVPQSFGMQIQGANAVGPNLCVYPNSTPMQTGGARKYRKRRSSGQKKRSARRVTKRNSRKYKKSHGRRRVARKSRRGRKCSCPCEGM